MIKGGFCEVKNCNDSLEQDKLDIEYAKIPVARHFQSVPHYPS